MNDKVQVFNSGGGTQSACIAALIVQGRLPKPDFIVIADTERERPAVWEYLDTVVQPALRSVGLEVCRVSKNEYAFRHSDVYDRGGKNLLLPVFTNQSGTVGKLSGYCSGRWKTEVIANYLRRVHNVRRAKCRNWIGFSLDESRRYFRLKISKEGLRQNLWFPLIEGVPLNRRQAIKTVEDMGWPTPPRSACWMCPNQGDREWRDLKANWPVEFRKAVELERVIQQRDPAAFFHHSCVPLDQVDFTEPEDLFSMAACNSGACFV